MAKSSVTYSDQSAGQSNYNIVFTGPDPGYINKAHVILFRDQVEQTDGFTWLTANTVQLDSVTTEGEDIMFRRITPKDAPIVDYEIDNVLTDTDLDTSALQTLYIVHEIQDGYINITAAGYLDADNKKIVNVANGTIASDAVNYGQLLAEYSSWESTFTALVAAAEAARDAALVAETNAETSETNAAASETNAATSETNAASSESNAATSETNAGTSETNAAASEAAALAAEVEAEKWAVNPEDSIIETNKYSALHYAAKSEEWSQSIEPKHAYDQPAAPTVDDNYADGWRVGSLWIHNEGGGTYTPYRCTADGWADPVQGDATWVQSVLATGEVSNVDYQNLINVPTQMFTAVELADDSPIAENGIVYIRKVRDDTPWYVSLPTNPANGLSFMVQDITSYAAGNPIIVVRTNAAHTFNNLALESLRCDISNATIRFAYDSTLGWLVS